MPAHKRSHRLAIKKPKKSYIKYGILCILILFGLLFLNRLGVKKYFSANDKLILAIQQKSGDVSLLIFDINAKEITRISVPGTLEVEAGRNFGKFRIKNIWTLGENEGIGGGRLLTETLTSSLKFPTFIWSSEEALNFTSTNPVKCFKPVFTPFKTNMTIGDIWALSNFCMKVKNIDRADIDLSQSTFLRKVTLADGGEGYRVVGMPSPKLYSNFNFHKLSENDFKVAIIDGTGNSESSKIAGEIIEIMGSKVSSITKSASEDFVCSVTSGNLEAGALIAYTLGCILDKQKTPSENRNIDIILGKKFPEVF